MVLFGGVKIGVLGGIGPEATGYFYNRLISKLQEFGLIKSNEDYPTIIINSIPAPELIGDYKKECLESYILGLKELDSLNPDFIVMVCNTIHLFIDKLQEQIKAPIINLRKEVEAFLNKQEINSILVLGTKLTLKEGLYNFPNLDVKIPTNEEQEILESCIFNFNRGDNKQKQVKRTLQICDNYLHSGIKAILLGCTEFAVMLKNEDITKINTLDVLIDYIINRFR